MYHRGHRGSASYEFQEGFLESRPGLVQKLKRMASRHTRQAANTRVPWAPAPPAALPSRQAGLHPLSCPLLNKSSAEETRGQERQEQPQSLVALTDFLAALPPPGTGLSHVPAWLLPHCARHRWVKLVERWLEEQVLGQLPRAQRGTAAVR